MTDMSYLFCSDDSLHPDCNSQCNGFNDDISNWNVMNVDNFHSAFYGAGQFDHPLITWDIMASAIVSDMFYGADKMEACNMPVIMNRCNDCASLLQNYDTLSCCDTLDDRCILLKTRYKTSDASKKNCCGTTIS